MDLNVNLTPRRYLMLETTPCCAQVSENGQTWTEVTLSQLIKSSSGLKMGRVIFTNYLPGIQ